ncbi:MAG: hypothetical protein A2X13_14835 [Bacteroidetes bacterium GWC2_33_15]|nr:MAG: hypothetical protein A2X10_06900 [Bacteroidetes bacterium GWA2_33_15]OFX50148.1 MAG: hypothetical protein A2X13_14835 [Bacteroidetes bacterium GWC2_33_15]OFX65300.1 MAG: hypothetical protein A2X15_04410 [Bacteroidetes bacterium GWB2_32_14]OFX70527.1 MAG: hypothetical protein A2X14_04465 [Bacteroidetes bacterium GWD2_33_33]HAN19599.1 integrase [Bacteroidales bacterium]
MNKLTVYLKDYQKSDKTSAVYIYTHLMNEKVRFNTGVSVNPDNWDPIKKRIKGTSKTVKDDNLIIDNCKKRITDAFVRYRLQGKELTPDLLRKEYKIPSTYIDFYDFVEKTILEQKGILSPNTIAMHESVLNKLKLYKKQLMFSEISVEMINDYKKYLKLRLDNKENTIQKNMAVFKSYINIAIRKKIITENPFDHIKIKRINPDRIYLDPEELDKLIELYRKNTLTPNHQRVLRYYLFACFTGLRVSDLKRITHDDIVNNTLVFHAYKTKSKVIKIPLKEPALILIKNAAPLRTVGFIFDTYSDQVTNRHLKKIATAAGIDKEISSHSARHTFATLFLRKTKNIAVLQKLLGHTNISETMIYAHVLGEDVEKEMEVFNDFKI